MHLEQIEQVPSLKISAAEKVEGSNKIDSLLKRKAGKTVGVFPGGRKLRGKRWPLENFVELISGLDRHGASVVAFLGPEENDIANALRDSLAPTIPIVCEPSVAKFAAMVASLDLFICCDSGPMHLACAAGVPVLAIFQERDVGRWAPPRTAARTVYGADGVSAAEVLNAALEELRIKGAPETFAIAAAAGIAGER
jgi:ADP-heptose:LPS heptosyltransferase